MIPQNHIQSKWTSCDNCSGRGKKRRRIRKKNRLQFQRDLANYNKSDQKGTPPEPPRGHLESCIICSGTGILTAESFPKPDSTNYPHVAIIGGGIGGTALAVACLHRGIPFTLYERDHNFEERSQGYGLTLQQASKAIRGLGIIDLKEGVISSRHLVHNTDGKLLGEWGNRKWVQEENTSTPKRTNIHIARQALRLELHQQLGIETSIKWGHQFINYQEQQNQPTTLNFNVNGENVIHHADLVIGADGIRSTVRQQLIGENTTPLQYLGCIVILGICPLSKLESLKSPLLDSATVFQTANGTERIYMMPFDSESVMWQLSFPISEEEAKKLSNKGKKALKDEAIQRTKWHTPIPEILEATHESKISGYPVYDREILNSNHFKNGKSISLLGDAAHPMSPFKGQGANQALLDALLLARLITQKCRPNSNWREIGIRKAVLEEFEKEMLQRSAIKVKDSADAAQFLHSKIVLHEGDEPRGKVLKGK